MQKAYLALLLLLAAAALMAWGPHTKTATLISRVQSEAFTAFNDWIIKHAKTYREDEEKSFRFRKFLQNYVFIQEHNQRFNQGVETFQLAINQFADLDNAEFKSLYTGFKHRTTNSRVSILSKTDKCKGQIKSVDNPPKSVSWKQKAVAPVRNQGMCGSCWAFSATGALEGLSAIEKGNIRVFSVQQLVDCAREYGENDGCNGGDMDAAFWYVEDNGIALESSYPYRGKDQKCSYTQAMKAYQINECAQVPANKTEALMSAVVKQPVSIAVEADSIYFQFYSRGVMKNKKCGEDLDHGIVLTGYGTIDAEDYWECKNSWGANWGMNGYILISRANEEGGPGVCGILIDNQVPLNV